MCKKCLELITHTHFLHLSHQVIRPPFKPPSPRLSNTSTCALPPCLSSLPLHLPHSLPSRFLPSPNTTCWAAAWRAWGAAQRPPAPIAPRTPPRQPCPPPHPTPSPTPPSRACHLPRPSPPTPTTPDCTPSKCPSSSLAPQNLQHGPWVHTLSWLWHAVCVCICVCAFFILSFRAFCLVTEGTHEHARKDKNSHKSTHTHSGKHMCGRVVC